MPVNWEKAADLAKAVGPTALSSIGIGVGLIQGKKNREAQEKQNKAQREWERELYELQRRASIKDWNAQNSYNSPLEQMNRLRQAGLNPNLVYGKGADNTAAMVRGATGGAAVLPAPKFSSGDVVKGGLDQYYQLKQSQAATDNLYMQAAKTAQDTAKGGFELEQAKRMKDTVVQQSQANLDNTKTDTIKKESDITVNAATVTEKNAATLVNIERNEREALINSKNIEKTVVEILQTKKQTEHTQELINLAKQEGLVRKVEVDLAKNGILKSDPKWWRLMLEGLKDMSGKRFK